MVSGVKVSARQVYSLQMANTHTAGMVRPWQNQKISKKLQIKWLYRW